MGKQKKTNWGILAMVLMAMVGFGLAGCEEKTKSGPKPTADEVGAPSHTGDDGGEPAKKED
jgi:hypothetical protein